MRGVSRKAALLAIGWLALDSAEAGALPPRGTYVWPGPAATSIADPTRLPPGLQRVVSQEAADNIQRGCETVVWSHEGPAPRGTVVLVHGYSAGTWQFDAIGPMLHGAGFNVYAPRMIGHGYQLAGGEEDATKLLRAGEWRDYHEFAQAVYQEALTLGEPISLMAISGGANVSLSMLEHHTSIARAVLVAPFMSPINPGATFGIALAKTLDVLTGNGGGAWLDTVDFTWGEAHRPAARAWGRPGHWDMKAGNVYGLMNFGQDVLAHADRIQTPLQLVTTGSDDVAAEAPIRELHRKAGGPARNAYYHFPAEEKVPHPMIHFRENANAPSLAKVTEIIRGYLADGMAFNRE